MLISGGIAGVVGKAALRAALSSARVTQATLSAGRVGTAVRATTWAGQAAIEGTTFTAIHAGLRNREWFVNSPTLTKDIVINSLGFGLFRSAQTMNLGIPNKVVD